MIKDGVFWFISAGVAMMAVGQWINYKYPLPPDLQKQYIFTKNAIDNRTTGGYVDG
jgi:hypothetical protein